MSQPEEKSSRGRTVVLLSTAVSIALLAGLSQIGWKQHARDQERILLHDGRLFSESQGERLLERFAESGIENVQFVKGQISIPSSARMKCNEIVQQTKLENSPSSSSRQMGALTRSLLTPSQEARLEREEKLEKIRSILTDFSEVRTATIVYDNEVRSTFDRKKIHSAVVTLWPLEDKQIDVELAKTVQQIVQKSFAGMSDSDVLVVDGSCGKTYSQSTSSLDQDAQAEIELSEIKRRIVAVCRGVVAEFGNSQISIDLIPAKTNSNAPARETNEKNQPTESALPKKLRNEVKEVVLNGTGKIQAASSTKQQMESKPANKEQVHEFAAQLLGIEVEVKDEVVNKYIRERIGIRGEITSEQFARGVTGLRNEVTQKIIQRFHGQGIQMPSELVTLRLISKKKVDLPQVQTAASDPSTPYYSLIGGGIIGITSILGYLIWNQWRRRSNRTENRARYSEAGRTFVNRSQATTGSVLMEEVHDAVQTDPERSIQAFQELVNGRVQSSSVKQ